MVKKKLILLLLFFPILFIYKNWFTLPFLSAPDFPYFFQETLADYRLTPPVWASTLGIGMGGEMINQGLGTFIYFLVSLFVNTLGMPWEVVYKVFIFGLFLVLSVLSSIYLLRTVVGRPTRTQYFLSALLFTANTYILMVVDGGQVGVALAYSVAPLVLASFINLIKYPILAGLVLALQVMFDLRVALLTLVVGLAYGLYHYMVVKRYNLMFYGGGLFVAAIIVFGLHAHWLLPIAFFRSHPAQEMVRDFKFGSLESFRFFSFATFSQSLSLLHPNWPENIFGKVYFMRPEFLVLPLMAFSSLLFSRSPTSYVRRLVFFPLLAILGAFLAKGANPPFPEINTWVFAHIPFSSLFRDPTKFYILTALSYSVLIPISAHALAGWANARMKNQRTGTLLSIFSIVFLFFLLQPVFLNQLNGTFAQHDIPNEYVDLKDFLHNQPDFFRTLWVPKRQRYNYYTYAHPAVAADRLFSATGSAEIVNKLRDDKTAETLANLSIRYVIVPYDRFGEIFVRDRKYDEKQSRDMVSALDATAWLGRLSGFGNIAVYEAPVAKDHFWLDGKGGLTYTQIGPSTYKVNVSAASASQIVFTDAYSPYWVADTGSELLPSRKTAYDLNSFFITKAGDYELTVYFGKQKYFTYGGIVTFIFILLLLFAPIYRIIKRLYERTHRRKD